MSQVRLAIGPANYAGQAHEWAGAVNRHTDASAWSFTRGAVRGGGFSFETDLTIHPMPFYVGAFRGLRSGRLFSTTTHVALDGYQTLFRRPGAGTLVKDIGLLERMGKKVALIAHGSDIRDPERHRERIPHSYFREGDTQWRARLTALSAKNRRAARQARVPLFVSTPDLLIDLPEATWLPLSIDTQLWECDEPALQRAVPRVLHLPSRRTPPIKGTQYIEPVLRDLEARGVVEYVSPEFLPHSEVRALVQSCDIVIDQLLTGSYGVAAVEAMAAARVVIGGLAPDVRSLMPETPQLWDADPDNLASVMSAVLDDRDAAREAAEGNLEYVRRWHDGRGAAHALSDYLGPSVSATD